jgi:hypothetical protein
MMFVDDNQNKVKASYLRNQVIFIAAASKLILRQHI